MSRSDRMFEIILTLRRAERPMTADALAEKLEVTKRTVYRDIAALQAARVPIAGEAGVGYVLRPGFELPPLMFTAEEVEAIVVGLALLRRTGDSGLEDAAGRVADKIADVLPGSGGAGLDDGPLVVSSWHTIPASEVDLRLIRRAIREEEILALAYRDEAGRETARNIRPITVIYYIDAVILVAWCDLRRDFRHFRADRIVEVTATGEMFVGERRQLRAAWEKMRAEEAG